MAMRPQPKRRTSNQKAFIRCRPGARGCDSSKVILPTCRQANASRQAVKLKVCEAYLLDGERLETFPDNAHDLARCVPVYRDVPGFGEVSHARTLEALPASARAYLDRIAEALGAEIALVSVGPGRGEDIELFDPFAR